MRRLITLIGKVTDESSWSGTAYYFYKAGKVRGLFDDALNIRTDHLRLDRYFWNCMTIFKYRKWGGYQYSDRFLSNIEGQLADDLSDYEIISFSQHFPRSSTIYQRGGKIWRYVDATLKQLFNSPGYNYNLSRELMDQACSLEKENYLNSEGVVAMSRWAADSLINDYDIPRHKVHVILPGANIILPEDYTLPENDVANNKNHPFRMIFVGKDWKRKGLDKLIEVAEILRNEDINLEVRIIGNSPKPIINLPYVRYLGRMDKATDSTEFVNAIKDCDLGCLFSTNEALGISILEFLRIGIPVIGFELEGMADTIPKDAGFGITPGKKTEEIAHLLIEYINSVEKQNVMRENAGKWSDLVTWERCISEWEELLNSGIVRSPVYPWKGLPANYVDHK